MPLGDRKVANGLLMTIILTSRTMDVPFLLECFVLLARITDTLTRQITVRPSPQTDAESQVVGMSQVTITSTNAISMNARKSGKGTR